MPNILAPQGLVWSHMRGAAGPNYQLTAAKISSQYATSIPLGAVVTLVGGYVTLSGDNPARIFGVFNGVYPYWNSNFQQNDHGKNGAWIGAGASVADVPCSVITDHNAIFRLQCSGVAPAVTWQGLNLNWVAGTNATLSASGRSVLTGDAATPAANAAFPFIIEGLAGVVGSPQDPTTTNPTLLVRLNPILTNELLGLGA